MTVSSTSSSSGVIASKAATTNSSSSVAGAASTSGIDVATIVSQLMTSENAPLDNLKAKITSSQTQISDLGTLKSKIVDLQSALTTFEDPSTFNNPAASSSDVSVVTATASGSAAIGSVSVLVTQLAQASKYTITKDALTNFSSASAALGIDANEGFQITVNGKTYSTKDASTPLPVTGNNGTVSTVTDLKNWLNGLGANISASIVQTSSQNDWVLQVGSNQTGLANAITNISTGAPGVAGAPVANLIVNAQDAQATIGGLAVDRPTNTINDVVNGITFNLVGLSNGVDPASINVVAGPDNSSAMINALIKAYNAVVNQYNTLTANSVNSSTPGNFANNPALLSFVNDIKSMFSNGTTDPTTASITGFSAASDTVNLDSVDGYLQIGTIKYSFARITQAHPLVSDVVSWINGLNAGVTASFDGESINLSNTNASFHLPINISGVNNSIKRSTISLASMGMDLQLDGTIQFNTASYQNAVTNGLYQKLGNGLKIGYTNFSSNLDNFLNAQVDVSKGYLVSEIKAQQQSILDMQSKQTDLQVRLNAIQSKYVSQYSALNTLLFQLDTTSKSLASALAAVTNINAGK